MRRLLRSQYDITAVASPIDALKEVVTRKFHLIISDQRMPEMTGVELLEKVKGVQPDAVRILLTGYTDVDSVIGAVNRGQIYRYIAKPWDPEDLKITLRQANEAYKMRREIEAKNGELSAALKELETLDSAKARFLSLVSHELNTPLTILSSYVPLLREKNDREKAISAIEAASQRLSEVVKDVVDFVKIESKPKLDLIQTPVANLIEEAFGRALKFAAKPVSLDNRIDSGLRLPLDNGRMALGFEKFFLDSIGRAPAGSVIRVTSGLREGHTVIQIERQGEPLSQKAFEPLEFGGDPLKHRKSVGLSLALFRSIIEAHGGSIAITQSTDYPVCVEITLK
ncbi:MAG: hybrid sensor histidine kinase/response regulator [Deltaproteobacteria bacterium]|nr:hybrid sensor histidine kinase/response regulator [Deltaproteobacteria bacterium]